MDDHNIPPLEPILSRFNPVHILTLYVFIIYLKIILPSTHRSPRGIIQVKVCKYAFVIPLGVLHVPSISSSLIWSP